jgi:anaerobic selenocysteine-containing dehydrogenase
MRELKSNCSFCSLACPLVLSGGDRSPIYTGDSILTLDWDKSEDSKYGGSLCARGNAVVEVITHPKRLNYPFVLGERTSFQAAVKEAAKNLAAIKKESGGDSIGILVGENVTNEEAALALRFARDVLGTKNISLFAPDDTPVFRAYLGCDLSAVKSKARKPHGDREVALIIGDSFAEHPCTAKLVIPGKYASRGSEVIVVGPELSNTAQFANRHLRCRAGGEAAVVAGLLKEMAAKGGAALPVELKKFAGVVEWDVIERAGGVSKDEIEGAAESMLGAVKVRTYTSNIFGRMGEPGLTTVLAEAATRMCPGENSFNAQFVQQNTWGVYSVLAGSDNGKILENLDGTELKALILLGLDLFSAYPAAPVEKALREKKFTVTTQLFWNQTASRANVVIPAVGLIEKKGTVSPAFGEDLVRNGDISSPGGTYTDGEFILALAREMGTELPADISVERETSRSGTGAWIGGDWDAYVASMKELESAESILIPWSEPVHVADGALSRYFHWSQVTCADPKLMISNEMADEMKLEDGDSTTITTEGGEASLTVERTGKLEGNIVGATIHFPAVRRLFPWKLSERYGEIRLAPVPVQVSRQSGKS